MILTTQQQHEALDLIMAQYLIAHPRALLSETSVMAMALWHSDKLKAEQAAESEKR